MSCKFVCDGCGKEAEGSVNRQGQWFKPSAWYQRTDDNGTQLACSRECIDRVAEKTGATRVVVPF